MEVLLVLLSFIGIVSAIDWDLNMCYSRQESWPKECQKRLQAPIPLCRLDAIPNNSLSSRFNEGYMQPTLLTVSNIGITWEIKPVNNSELYIIVNRIHRYYLGAVYPHWPSEHTIDGERYDLELQLVHYKIELNSWEKAARTSDGVYVISILHNLSDFDNPALDCILQLHSKIFKKLHTPFTTKANLGDFIPKRDKSYYKYKGSVPIPDCPENLIWQVYTEPSFLSKKQLYVLKNIYSEKGIKVLRSNRDLNDVNNRIVYFSKDQQC